MDNFGLFQSALENALDEGVSFVGQARKWETEAPDLIEAINQCKNLTCLNLEGNTLGVDAAKAIGEALKSHPELKRALLKDLFTGRMKTEIPPALIALGAGMIAAGAQLTVLDCSDNALGPNGMVGLVGLIRSTTCYSLQELRLNNCGLGITGGKMLAQALLDCVDTSTKAGRPLALKVFVAGRNRLENEGAKALAKVFGKLTSLVEVSMPQNGICHPGVSALSMAFSVNTGMRVLNLNDNTVKAEGAAALADAMLTMPELREVNLGDCLLKTSGASLLAQALVEDHQLLENLNFGFNEIGPDGGLAVADAMANKTHLNTLNLDGNHFGREFRDQIEDVLRKAGRLTALTGFEEDDSEGEQDAEEDDDDHEYVTDEDEEEGEDVEEDPLQGDEYSVLDDEEEDANYGGGDEEDEEGSVSLANVTDASVVIGGDESRPKTVETFVNTPNPSQKMFDEIAADDTVDMVAEFRKYLKSLPDDEYLVFLTFAILKTSALSLQSPEALKVSDALWSDCVTYAAETSQVSRVRNFFLIQTGLLKCEDKHFKPSHNLKATRHGMQSAMRQSGFPEDLRAMFQCFLDRAQA